MPIDPDFDQYDFNIKTDNAKYSKKLLKDIRNSWWSREREQIDKVEIAHKFKGQIYAIRYMDKHSPSTSSCETDSLAQHGWGYFTFSDNTLYVGRIIPSNDPAKEYVFEGRENVQFDVPSIRQFNNADLDFDKDKYSDKKQDMSLINDIMSVWPKETIKHIYNIGQNSASNSYTISTENYNQIVENSNQYVCTAVPLGKHVDVLLHNGWGVQAVKSNRLYISELQILIDDHNSKHSYKFDNTENAEKGMSTFIPKKCEFCEDHEYYGHLVTGTEGFDDDLPVSDRACKNCMKNSKYPTDEEFRNSDSVNIPN